jgi:hypothetical protein
MTMVIDIMIMQIATVSRSKLPIMLRALNTKIDTFRYDSVLVSGLRDRNSWRGFPDRAAL